MDPQQLRTLCLSFPGSVEEYPFGPGAAVYKVAGKMFALAAPGAVPPTVSLKCDPEVAAQLRRDHPGTVTGGYHLNKRHWNTVTLDGALPDEPAAVREMVEDSYDLVVAGLTRAARAALEHGIDPVTGRPLSGS